MRRGWSPQFDRKVLFGEVPWGYHLNEDRTQLVVDEDVRAILAVVRHMRERGLTMRQLVEELREMGIVNRRGKPFNLTRVFQLLHGGPKATTPTRRKRRAVSSH
jgi:hypothetical protein